MLGDLADPGWGKFSHLGNFQGLTAMVDTMLYSNLPLLMQLICIEIPAVSSQIQALSDCRKAQSARDDGPEV